MAAGTHENTHEKNYVQHKLLLPPLFHHVTTTATPGPAHDDEGVKVDVPVDELLSNNGIVLGTSMGLLLQLL